MKIPRLLIAASLLAVALAVACGGDSDTSNDSESDGEGFDVGFGAESSRFIGTDVLTQSGSFSTAAQLQTNPPGITVVATGSADAEPTAVLVSASIGSTDGYYGGYPEFEAVDDEAIDRIVAFLKGEGVDDDEIVVDKYASSSWGPIGLGGARISFRWAHPDALDQMIEELQFVTRQETEYELIEPSIWFTADDCESLADEALRAAFDDANERAEQLADEAGLSVGPIISVSEFGSDYFGFAGGSSCPEIEDIASYLINYGTISSTSSKVSVSTALTVTYAIE